MASAMKEKIYIALCETIDNESDIDEIFNMVGELFLQIRPRH
jgi:hypothetical protein